MPDVSACWTSGPTYVPCKNGACHGSHPTKLKAVRLLGHHPIDAIDSMEVAWAYLASHVLLNHEGDPFQEIMNELSPDEASVYASYLQHRRYDAMTPNNPESARQMLLDLVDRVPE